jgi:hypothetical protein
MDRQATTKDERRPIGRRMAREGVARLRFLRRLLKPAQSISQHGTILRQSALWNADQYVDAAELDGTARVELVPPAVVPIVNHLRKQEGRVWRPEDYGALPSKPCPGPGYTMLEGIRLVSPGMALARDGRFIEDPLTRLNPRWLSQALEQELSVGAEGRRDRRVKGFVDRGILVSRDGVNNYGLWTPTARLSSWSSHAR